MRAAWSPSNPSARNRVHHLYPAALLMLRLQDSAKLKVRC